MLCYFMRWACLMMMAGYRIRTLKCGRRRRKGRDILRCMVLVGLGSYTNWAQRQGQANFALLLDDEEEGRKQMCLATTYPPGGNARSHQGGAASDSSSFSAPSVIEERANSHRHRVREVTERHVLLPMTSSCEEDDWDEPAALVPTATNEGSGDETIDPILTMRDREDDNDGTMSGGNSDIVDGASEEEGITINICGVPLCDDTPLWVGASKQTTTNRRGRRRKQHTNLDTIAEWRRQTSFSVTKPAQCMSITCGGGTLGRLEPIAEEQEPKEADGFRPLASVRNLFVRSRGGNDDDGIIAFRKCHSYQVKTPNGDHVERERYALADDIYDDEESVMVFSKLDFEEDSATAKTEETEGDVSSNGTSDLLNNIPEQKAQSILDNLCTNFCGIFSLGNLHKQKKSSGSSVVSLSDETMAEEGGIFVVRNGTVREIDLGEDIADTDDQLGIETSDRSYPGKQIEQSAKYVSDEIAHRAEDAGRLTLGGIAQVVRAMASTLTQGDVEEEGGKCGQDTEDENEEDQVRTAQAREHANMVKDALEDIDRDDLLPSQASF